MKRLRAFFFFLVLSAAAGAQTVTVTPSATTYASSGGTLSFNVVLSYPSTLSALGFQVGPLPANWSYASASGANVPQLTPAAGDTGRAEFAYTSVPANSASFTFVLSYSGGLSGTQTISGIEGLFRPTDGALQRVSAAALAITPAGGGPVDPAPVPPSILSQPIGGEVTAGQPLALSVVVSGTAPFTYQWRKDGAAIAGATASSYTIAAVSVGSAGSYAVTVGNSAGSIASVSAVVTVRPVTSTPTAPQVVVAPESVSVAAGGSATFSVTASGTAPLQYQWRRDGVALAGATSASLLLTNVQSAQAGTYSVVVANSVASVTSAGATLTVTANPQPPPPPPTGLAGTYFGTIGGSAGSFALHLRTDRTGVLLAYARSAGIALVSREVRVDANGAFTVSAPSLLPAPAAAGTPAIAAAAGDIVINGSISAARVVTGSIVGSTSVLSAPAPGAGNASAAVAGFYQAGAAGSADTAFVLVGESGDIYLLTTIGGRIDAGRGTVASSGAIEAVTEASARVSGVVAGQFGTLTATVTPAGSGAPSTLIGVNAAARTDTEKLVNISTRSPVGGAAGALFAGFVIVGDRPKPVLVRAIGPTLASFGVQGALSAAALEVFRGDAVLAAAGDWGAGAQSAAIASAAARVGAFALPAGSRDAALLLTLEPGAYTAVVRGQGTATGVGLVEVYDATEGPIPAAQRIVNVSTRSQAGTGDASLIAGFNVSGTVPKRVLVRGIGPGLVQFGVAGALARPQLEIFQRDTVLARNSGWGSADAPSIAAAAAQVGAFALVAGSSDAALLVNLLPGSYTVHLSGLAGTSGNALIEIYEVP